MALSESSRSWPAWRAVTANSGAWSPTFRLMAGTIERGAAIRKGQNASLSYSLNDVGRSGISYDVGSRRPHRPTWLAVALATGFAAACGAGEQVSEPTTPEGCARLVSDQTRTVPAP